MKAADLFIRSALSRATSDQRVAFMSFIGSAAVRRWVGNTVPSVAPGVRCALEHDSVATGIVAADANLNVAVPLLLKGGFYHAGQVCVSH